MQSGCKRKLIKELYFWLYLLVVLIAAIILMGIFVKSTIEFANWEKSVEIGNYNMNEEYIPIKELIHRKIMSMPIPKEEVTIIEDTVAEEVVAEKTAKNYTMNEEKANMEITDVELLARLMFAEQGIILTKNLASYEDAKKAHMLCGSVVIHRMNSKGWGYPNTMKEVIYQPMQYDCTTDDDFLKQEVPKVVYEWAEELLTNGPIGPDDLIYQAQFMQGSKGEPYDKIYNQYFCLR